jgi:1-deoxy-D-xylulose-5-phosphate synthase
MTVLRGIRSPRDVRALPADQLPGLAAEIRAELIDKVTRTGGHLGPNLGVVELTIALHRVFDSPQDVLVWDTGHQAYVHKMLTGRLDDFESLKQEGGLSGYPSRAESEHDVVENSHASTSLSWADGIAKARRAAPASSRAATSSRSSATARSPAGWPGRRSTTSRRRPTDRWSSWSTTTAGRTRPRSAGSRTTWRRCAPRTPTSACSTGANGRSDALRWSASPVYETLHGVKKGLKDVVAPQGMFEDLGLKYVGPVDGHDVEASSTRSGREDLRGPVLVHVLTEKGRGYEPALQDEADRFHAVGVVDPRPASRSRRSAPPGPTSSPTSSSPSGPSVPTSWRHRGHAGAGRVSTSSLGLPGAHLRRRDRRAARRDQRRRDGLRGAAPRGRRLRHVPQPRVRPGAHGLRAAPRPVTFVLDRAGITGDDGASHNGMWDMTILQVVPGLRIAAPRDGATLREELREAVDVADGPTVVRYPKGPVNPDVPAVERFGTVDVLRRDDDATVLIVSVGSFAPLCLEVADRLAQQGIACTVIDPRWVAPVPESLVELARGHSLVVSVEDNSRTGGIGSSIAASLRDAGVDTAFRDFGIERRFLAHGKRNAVLAHVGLTAQDVSRAVVEQVARLEHADVDESPSAEAPVEEHVEHDAD